jgi:hypothetical protein
VFIAAIGVIVASATSIFASRTSRSAAKVQTILEVTARLEEARPDRSYLRSLLSKRGVTALTPAEYKTLTADDLEHVDRVCRSFDLLGYMDRAGLIDENFVNELYAVSLCTLYREVLQVHVAAKQASNPAHYWELVQLYERVRAVPEAHPANTQSAAWPKRSRLTAPRDAVTPET